MEDSVRSRLENLEQQNVKRDERFDEKIDELKNLIMMVAMKIPTKEEPYIEQSYKFNDEDDKVFERPKASKRDRQSIASIFTSDPPFTPASETKVKKDLKMPQFLKDYNKNITDGNENAANSNLVTEILIPESAKYTTTIQDRNCNYTGQKIQ